MDNWKKLEELVRQNQFELLTKYGSGKMEGADSDLRLIYLMNDAVESFLVFRNAAMTGRYIEEFDGEIWIDSEFSEWERSEAEPEKPESGRTCIILHQEENIVTIFFDRLDFEVYLFDYSRVGHFWVDGYEYLRQLEFKIAILGDKYHYIGKESCSALEQKLANLAAFPPLGYCCYPAVSKQYIVPRKDAWCPSKEAIEVMREIAEKAEDSSYVRWLAVYQRMPVRWMGKLLARKLHQTKHIQIARLLMKTFEEGCCAYPGRYSLKLHMEIPREDQPSEGTGDMEVVRRNNEATDHDHLRDCAGTECAGNGTVKVIKNTGIEEKQLAERETLLRKMNKAQDKIQHLREQGKDADLFLEETFWFADDGLADKVYLGVWEYGPKNTNIKIEEIQ